MNKVASNNTTRLGISTLNNFNISPNKKWYWIGFGALAGFTILFNVLFTISLMYLRPLRNRQAVTISKKRARKMEADLDVTNNAAQRPKESNNEGCFYHSPL
ncbi:transcription factor [Orobanche hederae]